MKTNIVLIGAGSASFAMALVRDLILTNGLQGSRITLIDIDKERLNTALTLARRYCKEAGAEIEFKATTDRKGGLKGADFVICAVKTGGYDPLEEERRISEEQGYYRGIGDRVSDYYGGIGAYHQFRFFLDLAFDIETICPDAWLVQTANPVFDGTNLVTRHTKVKAVGVCHGHFKYKDIAAQLGLDINDVDALSVGFNHYIFLTRFSYKGSDAYPLIDEWIDKESEKYWKSEEYQNPALPWSHEQMSRDAVDTYKLYGFFPIGDAVRAASPWWHHTDLKTKQKWNGPQGGFDSEIGWSFYLSRKAQQHKDLAELAKDPDSPLMEMFPLQRSEEQHIDFINAVVNNTGEKLQLNIPNNGSINSVPDDVLVEIPAAVSANGITGDIIGGLPNIVMQQVLIPRWQRMENLHYAFVNRDRKALVLGLAQDHRTRSYEQAEKLIDTLLAQPWNKEAEEHYR
jgi:alpha-galactosidase